ncbi:MAG TPA: NUDIX domain-containing protein [Acidimicrobiales bacterium]
MDDRLRVVNAGGNVAVAVDPRRDQLRSLLAGRRQHPVDDREAASVLAFSDALARLERPFDQDADPTHVTSSAIVTGAPGVILLRHKRLGIWVQPGGHLEPGEDLAGGAWREAEEETGLALEHPEDGPVMVHVDVHPGGRGHIHLDLRWWLLGRGQPAPPAGESQEVAWLGWDEAIRRADAGLSGALRALRQRGGAARA